MQLFGKFGVFTRAELESRSEIMYETYTKVISIEARTMLHMAGKHYIPAVVRNCTRLADSVCKLHTACPAVPTGVQETLLCQTERAADEGRLRRASSRGTGRAARPHGQCA